MDIASKYDGAQDGSVSNYCAAGVVVDMEEDNDKVEKVRVSIQVALRILSLFIRYWTAK